MKTAGHISAALLIAACMAVHACAAGASIIIGDGTYSVPADKPETDEIIIPSPFRMPEAGEMPSEIEIKPVLPDIPVMRTVLQEPEIFWENGTLRVVCSFSTLNPEETEQSSLVVSIEGTDGEELYQLGSYTFTGGRYRREYRLVLGAQGLKTAGCQLVVRLYDAAGGSRTIARALDMVPAAVVEPVSLAVHLGRCWIEELNGVGMTAVPFEYSSPSDAQVAYAVYDRQNRQVTSNSQSVGSGRGEVRFLWSGNFQGRRCPSGYYLIQYSITDSSGATELHSQEVYLEIPQI